jgi:hypothetical protein
MATKLADTRFMPILTALAFDQRFAAQAQKTDGKYSYKFRKVMTETVGSRKQKYPLDMKIEETEVKAEKKFGLKISDMTLRRDQCIKMINLVII